jgi:hypothetical protein
MFSSAGLLELEPLFDQAVRDIGFGHSALGMFIALQTLNDVG